MVRGFMLVKMECKEKGNGMKEKELNGLVKYYNFRIICNNEYIVFFAI